MEIARLESVSRVDQVMSVIRQAILTGDLKPGQPFKASELAAELGVSIIPIREALQRLATVGLIDLRQGRSARVSPLSADDLIDLYRLRGVLEGDAAQRSASHLTACDREAMAEHVERLAGLNPTSDEFWLVHQGFHQLLIAPAMTRRLTAALEPLLEGIERYVRLIYDEIGFEEHGPPDEAHRPILEAVRAGDPAGIRRELLAHYDRNLRWMLGGLSELLAVEAA